MIQRSTEFFFGTAAPFVLFIFTFFPHSGTTLSEGVFPPSLFIIVCVVYDGVHFLLPLFFAAEEVPRPCPNAPCPLAVGFRVGVVGAESFLCQLVPPPPPPTFSPYSSLSSSRLAASFCFTFCLRSRGLRPRPAKKPPTTTLCFFFFFWLFCFFCDPPHKMFLAYLRADASGACRPQSPFLLGLPAFAAWGDGSIQKNARLQRFFPPFAFFFLFYSLSFLVSPLRRLLVCTGSTVLQRVFLSPPLVRNHFFPLCYVGYRCPATPVDRKTFLDRRPLFPF